MPKAKGTQPRCITITEQGRRCRFDALRGQAMCRIHEPGASAKRYARARGVHALSKEKVMMPSRSDRPGNIA